jgi:hypothetical protein
MAKVSTADLKKSAAPGGRKLFPTGKTLVKVTFAERTLSSTGNERLTLTYEGQVGDAQGMKIRDDLYYTLAQSNWKVALVTESLGVSEFDPDDAEGLLHTFVGKKMMITVAADEYTSRDGDARIGRKISSYESLDAKVAAAQREERNKRIGGGSSRSDRSGPSTSGNEEIPF